MSTVLLTQITRTGTYPAQIPLDVTYNRGFISFVTNNWTAQMFYELPAIKLDLYTDVEGTMVRSPLFSRTIKTYNPTFPLDQQCSICISMKDVPTNCYLFVTPIFDNNAIEARNELIRNGIEDGQLWTTKTNTFNILLSYEDNDSIPTSTITQQPPISFTSDGTPLISWSMLGNGQQTGTPTPDNPITPQFVGVRTENLLDESTSSDVDATHVNYNKTAPIILTAGQTYTFACNTVCNGLYIRSAADDSNLASVNNASTLTYTPQVSVGAYCRVWNSNGITDLKPMLNLGSTALPYEPFGWAEKITNAGQTVPVYLGQVQTVRRIKKLVLTGDETAYKYEFSGTNGFSIYNALDTNYNRRRGVCSHYPVALSAQNNALWIGVSNRNLYFVGIGDALGINEVADFKTWLSTQYAAGTPVTVWYVLETPETGIVNEPLAKIGDYADELHSEDAGVTIPTVKGANTLTVDSVLQPSSMTITGNIK